MKVLSSLTKKYLTLNKKRTIVTIVGIILSCALIGGVANLVNSFKQFMIDTAIEDNGGQHAIIKEVDVDNLTYIEHNASFKETYKTVALGCSLLEKIKDENKPFLLVNAYDNIALKNYNIKVIKGRLPQNSTEIVISNQLKETGGINYKIGDKITVRLGDRKLTGETLPESYYYPTTDEEGNKETFDLKDKKEYTIVGIIEMPKAEAIYGPFYTAITYLDSDLMSSINSVNINVIDKNPKSIYKDIDKISKNLKLDVSKIEYNDNLLRWYGATGTDNGNKYLYIMALILIIVIMIASIIVIYNSFIISITERKKQFGMLSSIGATSKQLCSMVLKEGMILSLIGIPLGILFSILGIWGTLKIVNHLGAFSTFYESTLHLVISYPAILITIAFSSLTIFLSSLIPAIKVSKISPISAIRLTEDIKVKGRKLKTSKLTRLIFGFEGELGLKNMKRNKKKYRSTIISIFVSIVLFMTISGFANYSFKSALKMYKELNYNLVLYNNQDLSKSVDGVKKLYSDVSKIENIKDYSIVKNLYVQTEVDKNDINSKIVSGVDCDEKTNKCKLGINLFALGDHQFKEYINKNNLDLKDYENLENPKAILLENNIYYDYDNNQIYDIAVLKNKVGDKLELYSTDSEDKNKIGEVTIGKYSKIYPVGFGNDGIMTGSIRGFISDKYIDSFNNYFAKESAMFIYSDNTKELTKDIKELIKLQNIEDIQIIDINEEAKQVKNIILTIDIFLYGFIALVSLITVTNIINTITTSIYLRRREFAMIKAVGMTNKKFNKMIAYESIFYGIKGIIYGLPFGILIDYFLFKNVSSVFIYDYVFPYKTILIAIIFVFIIIFLTTIYSVRKIKKDNIVDVIKQENL